MCRDAKEVREPDRDPGDENGEQSIHDDGHNLGLFRVCKSRVDWFGTPMGASINCLKIKV